MEKIKLFTHNDADGVGCVVVAGVKHVLSRVDYEICSYNDIDKKIQDFINLKEYLNYNQVYITDISVNPVTADMIQEIHTLECQNWKLLDHHKTAEWLNTYDWAEVIIEQNGIKECGTSLFLYELFVFDDLANEINYKLLSVFVELIRSYDTWDWKKNNDHDAKVLNDIFKLIGFEVFIEYYYYVFKNDEIFLGSDLFPDKYIKVLYYLNINRNEYMENKLNKGYLNFVDADGNTYISVLCDRFDCTSELGSKLLDKFEPVDYVMLVYDGGIALRSRENIDVSVIAKKHGGGGHKNAAGFKCDEWWKWLLN